MFRSLIAAAHGENLQPRTRPGADHSEGARRVRGQEPPVFPPGR